VRKEGGKEPSVAKTRRFVERLPYAAPRLVMKDHLATRMGNISKPRLSLCRRRSTTAFLSSAILRHSAISHLAAALPYFAHGAAYPSRSSRRGTR